MISVETGNLPDDNSMFAKEFEEYRRNCRERYLQNKPPQSIPEEAEEESDDEVNVDSDLEEEVDATNVQASSSPVITDPRLTSSASNAEGNTPLSMSSNNVRLNSSVDTIKGSSYAERRNSFSKVFSFCSNVFKKTSGSPQMGSREKEKVKMERKKAEQDFRMARFIAELEMEGRSDEEIQLHLFHLRDQAQFARPRSNSVSEWFREMHQAFKDEFSLRNRQCVTVHVSTVNPFAAAVPANYIHEMGYSYEDLVALEPVPRGLKSLDHLPTTVYEGQELPSNQTTCAVCMADFETSEELRSLHCTHHFHKECIDKWLGVATTCPVCKGEVCNE
jgi:hypothetical protein